MFINLCKWKRRERKKISRVFCVPCTHIFSTSTKCAHSTAHHYHHHIVVVVLGVIVLVCFPFLHYTIASSNHYLHK